ncbi:putative transcription factor IIA, alpha/beta subunit, transcription factor IIA, beta-barrel [Septoria linicola]|nr:putative transcription factor IIA, alpha/beta subunit, transcription factor IIA, beta-barrel [Septoria linicola]
MTNTLVGDVYLKIIEEVVAASQADFEESGVGSQTLGELQQEWQNKLSARGVAQMPWDPKPQPPQPQQPIAQPAPPNSVNGLPANPYSYDSPQPISNGQQIKREPGIDHQYHGLPNGGYAPNNGPPVPAQGGAARAQQLMQQQFGNAAAPSLAAMQRGGLALPGQQQQQQLPKPQGAPLPQQGGPAAAQHQFQQQQAAAMARQQQQLQQQQAQPRIKVENDSPQIQQGGFQHPNYSQTDGADEEDDLAQWKAMLAERRAAHAQRSHQADSMMRDQVMSLTADLQSGLMVPLRDQPSSRVKNKKRSAAEQSLTASSSTSMAGPSIPQLDGDEDEDEEKPNVKDEDDPDAINSDLDDDDDEGQGAMGDDDDEFGDSILCTYDKVQRVKNKWKCTLKDGVMSVNGKEWVFHKGMGEFEW